MAPAGAAGATEWEKKTVDEILWDINKALTEAWAASEYDDSAMANHILLPPDRYSYIASTRIGTSGDESILSYVLKNNIAKNQVMTSRFILAVGSMVLVLKIRLE